MASERVATPQKLTVKGQATRERILHSAAELMYVKGVHGTNNEAVRRAAGVSGSQLNHYFPDKESLVLAVVGMRAEQVLDLHAGERFCGLDSIEALRRWAGFFIAYERACQQGCTFGSLAGEIVKTDLVVREQLAEGFGQWADIFRAGLARMRDSGVLRAEADPGRLAHLLLAAFQGGMLLAQASREITSLQDALTAAIDYIETFEVKSESGRARRDFGEHNTRK
jgi:TetR/AcrR family transcriptional repressor of nem operon